MSLSLSCFYLPFANPHSCGFHNYALVAGATVVGIGVIVGCASLIRGMPPLLKVFFFFFLINYLNSLSTLGGQAIFPREGDSRGQVGSQMMVATGLSPNFISVNISELRMVVCLNMCSIYGSLGYAHTTRPYWHTICIPTC